MWKCWGRKCKNLVLTNDECDSNFYEEDSTKKIKEFDEKVFNIGFGTLIEKNHLK